MVYKHRRHQVLQSYFIWQHLNAVSTSKWVITSPPSDTGEVYSPVSLIVLCYLIVLRASSLKATNAKTFREEPPERRLQYLKGVKHPDGIMGKN